jgi:GAF domain-containing protein
MECQAGPPPFGLLDSGPMSETVDTARQELLRTVAAGTAGVVGEAFLQRLVQAVGETFGGGVCWISELNETGERARSLASWPPEALPAGFEYRLEGTPCQALHQRTVVSYETGVSPAFPEDPFLIEHGLDGYLAVTCPRGDGHPIGYLAVTTQEALEARPDELAALQIFAARIGAELERRKQESRLREREAALIASRAKVLEAAD